MRIALAVLAMLVSGPPHFAPADWARVSQWLAVRSEFRLLDDSDCDCLGSVRTMAEWLGHPFHPYYAVGDFNRDGVRDFAVAVVRKRELKRFLVVFNGPNRAASGPPALVKAMDARDVLVVNPVGRPHLVVGPAETDIGFDVIWRPQIHRYIARYRSCC